MADTPPPADADPLLGMSVPLSVLRPPGDPAPTEVTVVKPRPPAAGVLAPAPATPPGYDIRGELGRGGMGIVYLAEQTLAQRRVALKMVLRAALGDPETLARFRGEAVAVAALEHPHIVRVYEVGECAGQPYMALEYCGGGSLQQRLDGTPWRPRLAHELMLALARGVGFAHRQRMIHRDLKPANVLFDAAGVPKVADFGLAKRLDATDGLTESGMALGTPAYMAPEVAVGGSKGVGPPADVFALGAMLYQLLTGRLPFAGATVYDILDQVAKLDPVTPRLLQPKVPRDLETICLKCLEKDPRRRYADADGLAEDLRRLRDGEPIAARPAGPLERAWKGARQRPVRATALALGLAAAVSLATAGAVFTASLAREEAETRRVSALASEEARLRQGEAQNALAQLERAEVALAAGQLRLAAGHLAGLPDFPGGDRPDAPDADAARLALERVPWPLRGWEWRHLSGRAAAGAAPLSADRPLAAGFPRAWCATRSPDGSRLIVGPGSNRTAAAIPARLWDTAAGRAVELPGHAGAVFAACWSADGATAYTLDAADRLRAWDAASGKLLRVVPYPRPTAHFSPVRGMAVVPGGGALLAGDGDSLVVVSLTDGQALARLPLTRDTMHRVRVASGLGGWLACSTDSNEVWVWRNPAGAPGDWLHRNRAVVLGDHTRLVKSVSFSPDGGLLATGDLSGTARVWRLPETGSRPELLCAAQATGETMSVDLFGGPEPHDYRLATVGDAGRVQLWEVETGRELLALPVGGRAIWVGATAGGRLGALTEAGVLRQWDAPSVGGGRVLRTPDLITAAVAPPGAAGSRVAVGLLGGGVALWTPDGLSPPLPLAELGDAVLAVAVRPDGRQLAATTGDPLLPLECSSELALIDLPARRVTHRVARAHERIAMGLAYGPGGGWIVSGSFDGTVVRRDAETAQVLVTYHAPARMPVLSVAVSADGRTIAGGGARGEVWLWDADAPGRDPGRPVAPRASWAGPARPVLSLAFHPDGTRLAVASGLSAARFVRLPGLGLDAAAKGGGAALWPLDGTAPTTLDTAGLPVQRLAFSPDGRRLYGVGSVLERDSTDHPRGAALAWDAAAPGPPAVLGRPLTMPLTLVPAGDGRVLVFGEDRTVREFRDPAGVTK